MKIVMKYSPMKVLQCVGAVMAVHIAILFAILIYALFHPVTLEFSISLVKQVVILIGFYPPIMLSIVYLDLKGVIISKKEYQRLQEKAIEGL